MKSMKKILQGMKKILQGMKKVLQGMKKGFKAWKRFEGMKTISKVWKSTFWVWRNIDFWKFPVSYPRVWKNQLFFPDDVDAPRDLKPLHMAYYEHDHTVSHINCFA